MRQSDWRRISLFVRNAIQTRYRAAVGGLVEVMLVFTIAGIISIGAYKQYQHCVYKSKVTNTTVCIRDALHNLSESTAQNTLNGKSLKDTVTIIASICECSWKFDVDTKTLSIEFKEENDARAVLAAMPELEEIEELNNKSNSNVLVFKKWDAI